MLHALGNPKLRFDWKPQTNLNRCYRNRFCTYEFDDIWQELVDKGFADMVRERQPNNSYLYWYYVTENGMKELLSKDTK